MSPLPWWWRGAGRTDRADGGGACEGDAEDEAVGTELGRRIHDVAS